MTGSDGQARMVLDYPVPVTAGRLPQPVENLEGVPPTGEPLTSAADRDYVRDAEGQFAHTPGIPGIVPDLLPEGALDGPDFPVFGRDEYEAEYDGGIVDDASVPDVGLSVRFFESGEGHLSNDLQEDRYQPVSENLDADEMRENYYGITDLLNEDLAEYDESDDDENGVAIAVDMPGDLTYGLYRSGDIRLSRTSDGYHMFDLSEEEARTLGDAFDDMARSWDDEFSYGGGANPDEVTVAAVGVSRKGLKSDAALRRYWVLDKDHKIMWGVKGDFKRCVRHLRKYVRNPQGLCNEYHVEALGVAPGQEHKHTSLTVPIVAAGGEDVMPYHVVENSTACGGKFAVMNNITGAVEGCHPDKAAAVAQYSQLAGVEAAAYAAVQPCPPGQHRMPDGSCMDDERMPGYAQPSPYGTLGGEMWHAVVHREGVSTGKRTWLPGSVSWRPTPFAMHQEVISSAHGSQPVTVYVGNVTRTEREGNTIHAWGSIDLDSPQGLEYARRLVDGFGGWPSFGPGSESMLYDVITDPARSQSEPDQIVFRDYRIGEFTAVSVPGQEGTYIEPLPALVDALAARNGGPVTAAAVRAHDTATSDAPWDADANVGRLPSPVPTGTARRVFAWIDESRAQDGAIPKDAAKFPHHIVSADGRPGAADLTACSDGIAALHGARGRTPDIPESDRSGVYNHLKTHLVDGGREPASIPALNAAIVTAAGSWRLDIPELPPGAWFDQPGSFPAGYAVTMSDRGEIVGLLAPRDEAHRTYFRHGEKKTLRSLGLVDYSRWVKETIVEGGARVLAGPLVMECMHAPTRGYGTLDRRNQYYEDSCSIFARVAIGELEEGTWIHGAALPGVSTEQAIKFLCCDVSGDWQPHPVRAGWTEFVAVLAVPAGGWPKEKNQVSTTVRENADELVIAGAAVPVRFEPSRVLVDPAVIEGIAAGMGLDLESRIRESAETIAHLMGGTP